MMLLFAAIFVWGMTNHPQAAGENSVDKIQAVSGVSVSGAAISGTAISGTAVSGTAVSGTALTGSS
ncbi:MAG: hypothetical protein ACI4SQ_00660, partial [Eubacterium sp.]